MSPLIMLASATTIGAVLFLVAGYLLGGVRLKKQTAGIAVSASHSNPPHHDALRDENRRLQQTVSRGELIEQEAVALRAAAGALREENRELRDAAAARMGPPSEAKAMQAKVAQFEQVRAENERLRANTMHLETIASELEEMRASASQAEIDKKATRTELVALRAQASQVSALQLQNNRLRAKAAGIEALRSALKTTRAQLRALQGKPVEDRDGGASAAPPHRIQHAGTMAEFVEQLVVEGGNQAAAVADGQGLLIAGAGDPDVQLAVGAVGAQFMTLVSRVRGFLPMGTFASLEARDAERRVLRIRRVEIEDDTLLLTTLREDADTPVDPLLEALHRHVPELMAGEVRVLDESDKNA